MLKPPIDSPAAAAVQYCSNGHHRRFIKMAKKRQCIVCVWNVRPKPPGCGMCCTRRPSPSARHCWPTGCLAGAGGQPPCWRGRGYGSYLVKELLRPKTAGFDPAAETRLLPAPLPAPENTAAWALARRFGFVRQGDALCRLHVPDLTAVRLAQQLLAGHGKARRAVRWTPPAAPAHDTLFFVPPGRAGRACDRAWTSSPWRCRPPTRCWPKTGMDRIGQAILADHRDLLRFAPAGSADCVMFNFGWLPGAAHTVHSQAEGVGGGGACRAGGAENPAGCFRQCCTAARSSAAAKSRRCWTTCQGLPLTRVHRAGLPVCQLGRDRSPALPGVQDGPPRQ